MRRRLVAVFAIVVAAFVALDVFVVVSLWPQVRTSEALSTQYAANSVLVSRMIRSLHLVRSVATAQHVYVRGESTDELPLAAEVAAAREALEQAAIRFEKGPMSAQEAEVWREISLEALPAFYAIVDEVMSAPSPGDEVDQQALAQLRIVTLRMTNLLERLAEINAEGVRAAGAQIHGVVVQLVVISIAIGTVALAVMLVLVRSALEAVQDYERSTAERLDELDQFVGRVAHDLRNPLQAVSMSLELLARRAADDRTRTTVERAQQSVQRMTAFIQDLLEFARSGAKPQPGAATSVAEVFRAVEQDLAPSLAAKRVEMVARAPQGVRAAMTAAALRAIVENLADNAVKHMPDDCRLRRVELIGDRRDGEIEIVVRDTGAGIPEQALPRLFDPFFRATSNPGGFGIGLKTVKRLVDAHGGRIAVESRVGQGTTFRVRLPQAKGGPEAEPTDPAGVTTGVSA